MWEGAENGDSPQRQTRSSGWKNKAEKGTEMPLELGQTECMNNFVDYVMNGSTFNSTRVTLVHTSACWYLLGIHFCLRVSTLRMTLVHTFGPFPSPGAAMAQHWVQQPSIRSKVFSARSNLMQFFGEETMNPKSCCLVP